MKPTKRLAAHLALSAGLLAASVQAVAQPVSEEEFWTKGLEYILSEYALDAVSYTSCGMTLAKMREPANFAKVKSEFLEVFPAELRPKAEQVFYSNDMRELKEKIAERGVMKAINNAKAQGQNMNRACENGIKNLINLNETARKDWDALKARLK
jgi:predicted nucleotide-binding protein (sugar kinase/HSP70/actin superfamily)